LPLGAPGIPGRGGEQENISAQQILWLRFLGHRFIDPPAWDSALQRIDQRLHHVLRVTASRGKDDMEGPTLNEVRDSLGGIGDVARRALKRSTHVLEQRGLPRVVPDATKLTIINRASGSFARSITFGTVGHSNLPLVLSSLFTDHFFSFARHQPLGLADACSENIWLAISLRRRIFLRFN
jgi:hypothetical protein